MNSRRTRWLIIGGQAIGQLALVAVMPALTRTVPIDQMGVYQLGLSIAFLSLPVATARMEIFIPPTRSDHEVRRLVTIAWSALAGVCALLAISSVILAIHGDERVGETTATAGILVLAYGVLAVDNAMLIRRAESNRLVVRNVVGGMVAAILQLLVGLWLPVGVALALAVLFGRILAIAVTARRVSISARRPPLPQEREWTPRRGLVAIVSALAASATSQSLVIYSTGMSGAATTAQVGVAQRTAAAPLGLISQGITQAAQAELAPAVRSGDQALMPLVRSNLRSITPIAGAITFGLAVGGPLLAVPIFGSGWQQAGWIIAILALPSGFQLLFAPLMSIFVMIHREHVLLTLQLLRLIASLALAAAAQVIFSDFLIAVAGYALGTTLGYVTTFLVMRKEIRRFDEGHPRATR